MVLGIGTQLSEFGKDLFLKLIAAAVIFGLPTGHCTRLVGMQRSDKSVENCKIEFTGRLLKVGDIARADLLLI